MLIKNAMTVESAEPDPHRAVRYWLYVVALLVAIMVLVGGATRLTDSGLSITEWAPITGVVPPLSVNDWIVEFQKYQTTTEYQTINKGMSLEQFKVIFWWEWGHRFLGRFIGFVVLLPLIGFWVAKRLPGWLKPQLIVLLALGGLQAFIGWWMVKSGLTERVDVSQIRLAIHLTLACVIFVMTVWLARSLAPHTNRGEQAITWQGGAIVGLILIQIFIGGLLAGLDAGLAYNTWPLMDGAVIPDSLLVMQPAWLNLTDNAKMVQFLHRMSAYALWLVVLAHAVLVFTRCSGSAHARRAILLFVLVSLQAVVGIVTLLLQVPFSWALLHQFGGVVLLAFATAHWRAFSPRTDFASRTGPGRLSAVHEHA